MKFCHSEESGSYESPLVVLDSFEHPRGKRTKDARSELRRLDTFRNRRGTISEGWQAKRRLTAPAKR